MGNSSKKDVEYYAEWTKMEDCTHAQKDTKINKIHWYSVPMSNPVERVAVATGRVIGFIFTLGQIENITGTYGKTYTHDIIEVDTKCDVCGKTSKWTLEKLDRKYLRCGYYKIYDITFDNVLHCQKNNMTFKNLNDIMEETNDDGDCKDFAERCWNKAKNFS